GVSDMQVRDQIYINGEWVKPAQSSRLIDVVHAGTGEPFARAVAAGPEDVDRAVKAARAAFDGWSQQPLEERCALLDKLQAGLAARSQEIATAVAQEVGMPLKQATMVQAGYPAMLAGMSAGQARSYTWEEPVGDSLLVHEPIGVVGCITPWNYPLLQVMQKIGPALAAGCTIVLKPSEVAPLSAFILAEVIDGLDVPAGVFNLVSGDGPTVGEALAAHPDVDMVSFTGSTRAGKRVTELAAQTIKRVALELGGKSPSIILEDADLDKAVAGSMRSCYMNSGQTCIAQTRMLVPRKLMSKVSELAKARAESLKVGDPLAEDTRLGPLASAAQLERVRNYIVKGIEEGAELVTGGAEPPEGLDRGFFVKPTVFTNVKNNMTIAQEEIFGPVLSIIPYDDEDEAVRIANDTVYGLSGAVWSGNVDKAKAIARRLRTGQVVVNGGRGAPGMPFGGYKQSGNGREAGKAGLEEFLEIKALQL
ncbi:MAG: aldehyde dehydrogenase family protein, partial [Myxococcales bacterium]|nr:aldehyde dehydrogenase family protein [Myxococcales bacterium]MDD9967065.1 aldehyde dehydrogenase family protein [Myxococcales bacterium]